MSDVSGIEFTLSGYKSFFELNFPDIYAARVEESYANWQSDFTRDKTLFDKETHAYFGTDFDEDIAGDQDYKIADTNMQFLWEKYLRGYDIYGFYNSGIQKLREAFAGGPVPLYIMKDIFDKSAQDIMILFTLLRNLRELLNRIQDTAISESNMVQVKGEISVEYTKKMGELSSNYHMTRDGHSEDGLGDHAGATQTKNLLIMTQIEQVKSARKFNDDEREEWTSAIQSAHSGRDQQLDQMIKTLSQLGGIMNIIFR